MRILEYDTHQQMTSRARDAFFQSIAGSSEQKTTLNIQVRRNCLVEDSLTSVSQVISSGAQDIKKKLIIGFKGEEGIDGGGLRKEWFLLLVREVFDPLHGSWPSRGACL
jgi:E3 ubiquitin-protein ligase HECTD2